MKKRIIASIALGGAALFAVPAGVAYAVADGADTGPIVTRPFDSHDSRLNTMSPSGSHGAQSRGDDGARASDSAPRGPRSDQRSGVGPMRDGVPGMGADAAALVEPGSTITADETASLVYMVEEEKLAHDLYVELGDAWDMRVFVNIQGAETHHSDAVRSLLDAYGVDDPTAGMATGEFANPELQSLYDTLLARGLTSETAALEVGALVEETDIADLRDRESTNVAIDQVFSSLESGSENHLRAFAKNLDRLGVTYDAQVLSSSDVASIIGQ